MQIRSDQIAQHLAQAAAGRGLQPVYTVHGDEPLLAQEAADAIRAAARAAGHSERSVFTVAGAHFDWSAVLAAAQSQSLFADRQMVEIRIPSGKPGKDGGDALKRYCDQLAPEVLTLVMLPRLDRQQQQSAWFGALTQAGATVEVATVERAQLPAWIARRLAAQGQRVAEGEEGQQTLAFIADRVEGNLLAAHQELQKLALLHPAGVLGFEQVSEAVLNVARYDVSKLPEAALTGQAARLLRMLDGLRAEGEAPVLVLWHLADAIAGLKRVKDLQALGRPLPAALNEARVWGPKQRLFERVLPQLQPVVLAQLVQAASQCDGIVKGLKHPLWPLEPWDALKQLALQLLEAAAPAPRGAPTAARRLAMRGA